MGLNDYFNSSYDNKVYGYCRVKKVDLERVKCKHCGWTLQFLYHKKQICPQCGNFVYPTKRDEFKEKLKIKIKEKENKNE